MTLLWRIIHEILFILGLCILVVGIVAYLFFKRLKTAWSISAACSHQEPSPETKEEPLPPFLDAIKRNDIESVKQLWEEGADPNSFVDKSPQKDGSMRATALMLATRTGDTALVGLLLDAGADIDYCSPRYGTALSVTAANSDLLMLQYLLERGANVNLFPETGYMVLYEPIWDGNLEIIDYLIQHGADVNLTNTRKETALIYAVQAGELEVAQRLIEAGAIVSAKDEGWCDALWYARRCMPRRSKEECHIRQQMITLLKQYRQR